MCKGPREQPYWDEHARFIDRLVDAGFIVMGGPLVDEGGALLIVDAPSEDDVRGTLRDDPWYVHGILDLVAVMQWEIFVDRRSEP
ncbi:MAG TPA: YciI family protein [Thermomicrobiales bacterium]|nr:YciI family protein [Thermomicrobiales bacterium]